MHATSMKHDDLHTKKRRKVEHGLGKKVFRGSMREEGKRLTEHENECNFLQTCIKFTKNKNLKMRISIP